MIKNDSKWCDSPVAIVGCESYDEQTVEIALKNLLDAIEGLDEIRAGMKVGIKANLVSMMKPDAAATTHPAVIKALAKMLVEKGAIVTIGDSPGGPFTGLYLHKVYQATGMLNLVSDQIFVNEDFSQTDIVFSEGKAANSFAVTSWILEQDYLINFCKLKTHGMMGMSCAVKNLFGIIPGTMKPEYHFRFPRPELFADMLLDLNEYLRPGLHIVDAVEGMEGNGPTAGTPRHIGALLAGKSPYSLDMVCAGLIGLKKEDILTLERAYLRDLGPESVEQVQIVGDLSSYVIDDYQVLPTKRGILFEGEGIKGKLRGFVIEKAMCSRPKVRKEECVGCKKCFEICPAKAITMENGIPKIDQKKCIHCFCCQEFCPKGAMKVHRPFLAKALMKI